MRGSEAAKRLKHERFREDSAVRFDGGREAAEAGAFGGANKPGGTPAPVWAMVRNRKISHAKHRNLLKEGFGAQTEGERSEPGA